MYFLSFSKALENVYISKAQNNGQGGGVGHQYSIFSQIRNSLHFLGEGEVNNIMGLLQNIWHFLGDSFPLDAFDFFEFVKVKFDSDLIWEKFEIGETFNFGNPP